VALGAIETVKFEIGRVTVERRLHDSFIFEIGDVWIGHVDCEERAGALVIQKTVGEIFFVAPRASASEESSV
jgi:hypothetical protein